MATTGNVRLVVATLAAGVVAGCGAAAGTPGSPSAPRAGEPRVVALLSASAEWQIVRAPLTEPVEHDTPFGDCRDHGSVGQDVWISQRGYGRVAAAGSTQSAIERWPPPLLVSLGTCGGF